MKNYYIKTTTEIFKDDFNEGKSSESFNGWQNNSVVKGENPMQAVRNYFEKVLFYSFEEKHAHIEHELNGVNCLLYSNYVDNDNMEIDPDGEEMAKFKKAEIQFFIADTYLEIFELVPAKL